VLDTDKNVGTVIISSDLAVKLAYNLLNDHRYYQSLDIDPSNEVTKSIGGKKLLLKLNGDISSRL
jgi:hypothetical protein